LICRSKVNNNMVRCHMTCKVPRKAKGYMRANELDFEIKFIVGSWK